MLEINKNDICALIDLVDDSDKMTFDLVKENLIKMGKESIPLIEESLALCLDPDKSDKLREILHEIRFNEAMKDLVLWSKSDSTSILKGFIAISKINFDIDKEFILSEVERHRRKIWLELNDRLTELEKAIIIQKYIFNNFHFQEDDEIELNIQKLFSSKTYNKISVVFLYGILVQELKIATYPVIINDEFYFCHTNKALKNLTKIKESDISFYLSPIYEDGILSFEDFAYIHIEGLSYDYSDILPISTSDFFAETISHIQRFYGNCKTVNYGKLLSFLIYSDLGN